MKLLLATSLLLSLSLAQAGESPSELIVKMKPGSTLPQFEGIKVQNLFGRVYVLRGKNLQIVEKALSKSTQVEYTERNHRSDRREMPVVEKSMPAATPMGTEQQFNDPMAGRVWAFNDAAQNGVSVNAAYKEYGTTNTSQVIVAVVDTGVDYNHEDLKNVVWTNPGEIAGNKIDDDGNGYVDDVYGINTLVRDSNGKATANNMDGHSHGTHVSGTIAAAQNNGTGIAGIASNVRIMGIRTVPNNGDETDVDVAEAFIYAAKNGAKLINCSFGKSHNEGKKLIPETLKYIADTYGTLVVAAAGNDSSDNDRTPTYPASFDNENLLIIASTSSNGGMSYFSNYGKNTVDVAAPGSNVYSTTPGNRYESMSGTSMATPTTVGVAAEVLSHFPNLTYKQLKEVLMQSVTKVDSFKNKMVSGGRIDLKRALELARNY